MKYFVKDGSKCHIAVIVLKWLFSVIMVCCTVWNFVKAPLGAVIYLLAGVLMCPLLVKNQKHKAWVIVTALVLYLLAPRIVCIMTKGTLF